MSFLSSPDGLMRERRDHAHAQVTFVELFFDLVFVFAVTQVSHALLEDFSLRGALKVGLMTMAVWWVWICISWVTNWLDPQRAPVRLALIVLMLAGLVMSTSLPRAFEDRALPFAAAYVFMEIGRSVFMLWALGRREPELTRHFQRVLAWLSVSGAVWLAGAFVGGEARLAVWALAVLVDYTAPMTGFWTPGLGGSPTARWKIDGGHMAERCGLFVIIALGEFVLVTGATFAGLAWTPRTVAAFLTAFVGSVSMWWLYFDGVYTQAKARIAASADPGRVGRAYTYLHLPIVAGIIVAAVANELVLLHPDARLGPVEAAIALSGPGLYLLGMLLFRRAVFSHWSPVRLGGLVMLAALYPLAGVLPALPLAVGGVGVLVIVAVLERRVGPG